MGLQKEFFLGKCIRGIIDPWNSRRSEVLVICCDGDRFIKELFAEKVNNILQSRSYGMAIQ